MKGWGAPNPCPFASREGLGPPTLDLQVVQGWGGSREGLGPNPCPFANRGWGAPNPSMQTKFKVFVGVRSGRKGPVMDVSIVGLESLSKQNLRFALGYVQSEPKGPVIHSSICGGAPGRLGNMLKHSTVWRPQCLSNQNLKFEVCVGVRRALSRIFRPLASNPCSSKI